MPSESILSDGMIDYIASLKFNGMVVLARNGPLLFGLGNVGINGPSGQSCVAQGGKNADNGKDRHKTFDHGFSE